MVRASSWLAILLPCLAGGACSDESHACTEIGCNDSAGFILHGDTWENGAYALSIWFDDAVYSCSFTMPDIIDSATGQGVTIPVPCTPELDASLDAVVTCTTHDDGSSSSQVCTPVPGHYYLSVQTPVLAESLSVSVTLNGERYFEASQQLTYVSSQPNGPSCEPTCHNATAELQVIHPLGPQPQP